jgi:hypothetical protein
VRQAGGYLAVVGLAVAAAILLAVAVHPLFGLVPLIMPGAPAALLAWATIRHGDAYDVTHRYK